MDETDKVGKRGTVKNPQPMKTKTSLTWKQRILLATSGRNDRGAFLWYSHDLILKTINEAEGCQVKQVYRSLSVYLSQLVKSGHMQRAIKPPELSKKIHQTKIPEYLYRRTGKDYNPDYARLRSSKNEHTNASTNAGLGHELWRIHRNLPKWFRRMMMD